MQGPCRAWGSRGGHGRSCRRAGVARQECSVQEMASRGAPLAGVMAARRPAVWSSRSIPGVGRGARRRTVNGGQAASIVATAVGRKEGPSRAQRDPVLVRPRFRGPGAPQGTVSLPGICLVRPPVRQRAARPPQVGNAARGGAVKAASWGCSGVGGTLTSLGPCPSSTSEETRTLPRPHPATLGKAPVCVCARDGLFTAGAATRPQRLRPDTAGPSGAGRPASPRPGLEPGHAPGGRPDPPSLSRLGCRDPGILARPSRPDTRPAALPGKHLPPEAARGAGGRRRLAASAASVATPTTAGDPAGQGRAQCGFGPQGSHSQRLAVGPAPALTGGNSQKAGGCLSVLLKPSIPGPAALTPAGPLAASQPPAAPKV